MGIKEYYFEIAPLKQTASESRLSRELHSVYGKKFKSLKIHEVYRLYGNMSPEEEEKAARELFFNPVVENLIRKDELPPRRILLTVKYKKGVLDTEARAVIQALEIIGIKGVESAVHEKKYIFEADISPGSIKSFAKRHLYNKVIEYAEIPGAEDYSRQRSCGSLSEDEKCPPQMPSSLSDEEKKEINKYFNKLSRRPSVAELEIIAQTWSEHCKHKTMTSSVSYVEEENGKKEKFFMNNLLKETVFKATDQLEKKYCLSVFEDNAGVISLDDNTAVAMKAETHNHPSALEPYGGASTGLGGVIRDVLGCGKGARPIMNFDVFCLGPSDMPRKDIPGDILHPKRIFEGVVKGVADYGNRMGIPTSAGALLFDQGYIYNPLVYCGTVGVMPPDRIKKKVSPGELIVVVGGKTGRDGIHGATFSSVALDAESDSSCVQIGDPVTEKKFLDLILKLRDMNLYSAITDCGAGGFSSAIGEMGSETGAEVFLQNAPLKYKGLRPWEIFLSESQERMVLSVPEENYPRIKKILEEEDVESAVLGKFDGSGRLKVYMKNEKHADIDMDFLHKGIPRLQRDAVWRQKPTEKLTIKKSDLNGILRKILGDPNVASKEKVVRQYDHEVQSGSVLKPYMGPGQNVPQDGCVTRAFPGSEKGVAVGLGINPFYSRIDEYHMAASVAEEAARNTVCAGGRIDKAAFMDNFCWGDVSSPDMLGSLVRACRGCYYAGMTLQIPFVSGKDSLNNFYVSEGVKKNIPNTLLITCVAPVDDISLACGSHFKKPGNMIYLAGRTYNEMACSAFERSGACSGGEVPRLRSELSRKTLLAVQKALKKGLLKSCHDLSEGGLAVALAEMCMGEVGAEVEPESILTAPGFPPRSNALKLFSESNSRFVFEVEPGNKDEFEAVFKDLPLSLIGETTKKEELEVKNVLKISRKEIKNIYCGEPYA